MKKAVFLFLLISPIFYSGLLAVKDIREQQFWLMLIGAAIFIGMNHYNKIIGYGVLYCVAHLAIFQRPAYINSMVQILSHLIIYDCVAKYYKGKNYKWPIMAVLALNLIMAALQYFKQDVFLHMDLQSPGLMTLPVYIGLYAAVTAPIVYTIHPSMIILSILGIIVSKSSFSAVAFAVAMSFYLWRAKSRLFKVFVTGGLVGLIYFVGFYDGPNGQFSRRIHIWKMVGSTLAVNPFGGWGLGSYDRHIRFVEIGNGESTREYAMYQPVKPEGERVSQKQWEENMEEFMDRIESVAAKEIGKEKLPELYKLNGLDQARDWFRKNGSDIYWWQDCHNGYLLAWFELGFPALILILWYCFDIWRRYPRNPWDLVEVKEIVSLKASFLAVVIISAAHFAIQLPRLSFTIMILLGILDQRLKGAEK